MFMIIWVDGGDLKQKKFFLFFVYRLWLNWSRDLRCDSALRNCDP